MLISAQLSSTYPVLHQLIQAILSEYHFEHQQHLITELKKQYQSSIEDLSPLIAFLKDSGFLAFAESISILYEATEDASFIDALLQCESALQNHPLQIVRFFLNANWQHYYFVDSQTANFSPQHSHTPRDAHRDYSEHVFRNWGYIVTHCHVAKTCLDTNDESIVRTLLSNSQELNLDFMLWLYGSRYSFLEHHYRYALQENLNLSGDGFLTKIISPLLNFFQQFQENRNEVDKILKNVQYLLPEGETFQKKLFDFHDIGITHWLAVFDRPFSQSLFHHRMTYRNLLMALDSVSKRPPDCRILDFSEWYSVKQSLRNPWLSRLLSRYPFPEKHRNILRKTEDWRRLYGFDTNDADVHNLLYSSQRDGTRKWFQRFEKKEASSCFLSLKALHVKYIESGLVQDLLNQAEAKRYQNRCKKSIFTPLSTYPQIAKNFSEYLQYLEENFRSGGTFGWDLLGRILNYIETLETEAQVAAQEILILAFDDARTAYHDFTSKIVPDQDYSCQKGFEERLLDFFAYLSEISADPIADSIESLIAPFITEDHGSRRMSDFMYSTYFQAAGYQLIEKNESHWKLKEHADKNQVRSHFIRAKITAESSQNATMSAHRKKMLEHQASVEFHQLCLELESSNRPFTDFEREIGLQDLFTLHQKKEYHIINPEPMQIKDDICKMIQSRAGFIDGEHLEEIFSLVNQMHPEQGWEELRIRACLKEHPSESIAQLSLIPYCQAYLDLSRSQGNIFYPFYHPDFHEIFWQDFTDLLSGPSADFHIPCTENVFIQFWKNRSSIIISENEYQRIMIKLLEYGYAQTVFLFLEQFSHMPFHSWEYLKMVLNMNHINLIEPFLKKIRFTTLSSAQKNIILYYSIKYGHYDLVRYCVRNGADLEYHANDSTPLMLAVNFRRIEILKLLLSLGSNPSVAALKNGETPLTWAVQKGDLQFVDLLVQAGASLNQHTKNGKTALLFAIYANHTHIVEYLVRARADMNCVTPHSITPLMAAVSMNHRDIVMLLLKNGAAVNLANQKGDTSYMMAASCGHIEMMKILEQHGASILQKNQYHWTALTKAVISGSLESTLYLLKFYDDYFNQIHSINELFYTAVNYGHLKIAELFWLRGADVNSSKATGSTPLMRAVEWGYGEIVRFLIQVGANPFMKQSHYPDTAIGLSRAAKETSAKELIHSMLKEYLLMLYRPERKAFFYHHLMPEEVREAESRTIEVGVKIKKLIFSRNMTALQEYSPLVVHNALQSEHPIAQQVFEEGREFINKIYYPTVLMNSIQLSQQDAEKKASPHP